MIATPEFLLRLTVIWVVLLAYYWLALRRSPLGFQRAYLLVTALAGCLIPLLPTWPGAQITTFAEPVRAGIQSVLDLRGVPEGEVVARTSLSFPWLVYGAGLLFFVARSLVQAWEIRRWTVTGVHAQEGGYTVIRHPDINSPFTVYGKIYLPATTLGDDLNRTALLHETAHLRQRHHYDTLLLQFLCTIFWFHPGAWLLRRMLGNVHEFEADAAVVETVPKKKYGLQLLRASQSPHGALGLFSSPLKTRIEMLSRNTTTQYRAWRTLLGLALIVGLIATCSDVLPAQQPVVTGEAATEQKLSNVPRLASLPDDTSDEDAEKALLEKIYGAIRYPKEAREAGLEGFASVKLIIEPDGSCKIFEAKIKNGVLPKSDLHIVVIGFGKPKVKEGPGVGVLVAEVHSAIYPLQEIGFHPTLANGKPVPNEFEMTFEFKLE